MQLYKSFTLRNGLFAKAFAKRAIKAPGRHSLQNV